MPGRWFPKPWRAPVLAALLLGAGTWLLLGARAEGQTEERVTPPVHEVYVDGVGVVERTPFLVKVEKGDTVGAIAQRHLDSARRANEILALNPKVNPKALRVGQSLVLPPRTATGWVDLFAAVPGGIAQPVGLGTPALLPWGPVTIFAVPHARVEALRALDRDRRLTEPFLRADAQVGRSAPLEPARAASEQAARVLTRLRVRAQQGQTLDVVVLDQQLLSGTGHRLVQASEAQHARRGLLLPLVLVAAGLVVFAFIALAARRLTGPAVDHERPGTLA